MHLYVVKICIALQQNIVAQRLYIVSDDFALFFWLYYYCLSLGVMPFSSNLHHTNIQPHYLLSRIHKTFYYAYNEHTF